jgi:hypothetical protein
MDTQPDTITLAHLEVVIMPNSEVLCLGKTVGWFKDLARFLHPATEAVK